ncbi:xanthine dehydrogenase family protein subunit M [Rhodobacter sp. SGA-6-6]|uniref:FAD binding domain-containing protein n=1 Tax=Rhodobacter sp. SGA-6-6 TaxID=2710882 RepID=UPI0013EBF6AD|nr:FAD binding domain-containing protein [Rhodobacter sp. SGA-6-6]NGM46578.1 xanthine dehydrogenase family protein subunit M [Rhodobacter sp. SGA-6-6]
MDYLRPDSLEQALAAAAGGARVLAGGTDLYPLAGPRLKGPVMDLAALPGITGIAEGPEGLRIGACTSWTAIAEASLPPATRALQQAALQVGGRQVQNAGTIGGNLCNASPAADGVPPLLVLGAKVELASATGTRLLALEDFLLGPRRVDLRPGELLAAVLLPRAGLAGVSAFGKLGARAHLVISIASAAVRLEVSGGRIEAAAVAVGACSPVPRRLPSVEAALCGPVEGAAARVDPAAVAAALAPIDDVRASAAYRLRAAAELVRRAVEAAL